MNKKSIFRFKQFSLNQTNAPFKVGTDGVLCGALCEAYQPQHILDIGTGTGLIALMLAQKYNSSIDALEINKVAYNQAVENIENSPWKNRVNIINTSFQRFTTNKKYDLIVSNPPYFINSLKSRSKDKNDARHNDLLTPDEIIYYSKLLLDDSGKLCLIYPITIGKKVINITKKQNLYCSRIVSIKPTPSKKANRLYIEFKLKNSSPKIEELIIEQHERHQYSEKYIELTKAYYLNL